MSEKHHQPQYDERSPLLDASHLVALLNFDLRRQVRNDLEAQDNARRARLQQQTPSLRFVHVIGGALVVLVSAASLSLLIMWVWGQRFQYPIHWTY